MKLTAQPGGLLLDVYGTLVEEDDVAIAAICRRLSERAAGDLEPKAVAQQWGRSYSGLIGAAWINRSGRLLDENDVPPAATVRDLFELQLLLTTN